MKISPSSPSKPVAAESKIPLSPSDVAATAAVDSKMLEFPPASEIGATLAKAKLTNKTAKLYSRIDRKKTQKSAIETQAKLKYSSKN